MKLILNGTKLVIPELSKTMDKIMIVIKIKGVKMGEKIFSGPEITDLCESIMESHRALKTIGMIFREFDFEKDSGNAFQGKIQKNWFKSIIDEMISTQFEKLNQIVDIYTKEQEKL